jgi:hypothetical protein
MWHERLSGETRYLDALEGLRLLVADEQDQAPEFAELWEEMTMVRRSVPGATW